MLFGYFYIVFMYCIHSTLVMPKYIQDVLGKICSYLQADNDLQESIRKQN